MSDHGTDSGTMAGDSDTGYLPGPPPMGDDDPRREDMVEIMVDTGETVEAEELKNMSYRFSQIFGPTFDILMFRSGTKALHSSVFIKITKVATGDYLFDRVAIDGLSEQEIVNIINTKINTADAIEARVVREAEQQDGG